MYNQCLSCERSLTRYDDDGNLVETGETACCCGSIDEDNNYFDALCIDCCDSSKGAGIWEGKSAGGGYYIVNPSY